MKNKRYSIRKVSAGIISVIIGLSIFEIGTANAAINSDIQTDKRIIIDQNGVRSDVEPIPPENVTEKPVEKPPVKPTEKPTEKLPVKPTEKPIEKHSVKPIEKQTEKTTTNSLETDFKNEIKNEIKNDVLVGNLSGREIKVSFKNGSIYAEKLYVESLNDNDLNKTIKHKLGSDYNIIETFEIHFEKNDTRVDSNIERTVTVAIVKKDNVELEVYHIADKNTLEKVNSSYSAGELKFNINHFSKFTIVERIKIGSKDLEERTKIEIPEKIENKENNELPETNSIKDEKQLNKLERELKNGK